MASPMGPIVVDSGTPPSLGGLPEPQVRKNQLAAGPISPIVDQLDAENRRVILLTPDPHGHLGPAREAVAQMQQALSGTRQNPTMVQSSPTPMSGSRRFPSLVEESRSLGAYPNPQSGSRLSPTIIEESPTQMEEDECDQWFSLALEQGNDNEEEEFGVLERRVHHHSPISVYSSPAMPEPMSGTRDCPMLAEESPAPHSIMVEDSPAPQCSVVEESPVPMSGVKNDPCLVLESPEPTEGRAGTESPVPMSGTKDRPSLVDDSPAMPKVKNLCWGRGNPVEGGSATLPINLVSPPATTSPTVDPQPRVLPDWGGIPEVATGSEPVFASHQRIQSPVVVHESPQYIVVEESPPPPPQPNVVGAVPPPPSPRQPAYIEQVNGIPYLIGPSRDGGSAGDIHLVGGRLHLLLRAPHARLTLQGGPLVPPWQGGLLGEAVVGHLLLLFLFNVPGARSNTGGGT